MRDAGIDSVAEIARRAEVSPQSLGDVINLKLSPRKPSDGQWRDVVVRMAGVLQCDPEDLFSEAQEIMALPSNSRTAYLDEPQVMALSSANMEESTWAKLEVQKLLSCLSERERRITEAIMDGATFNEATEADINGRSSVERMRQIYARSLRKMKRHAAQSDQEFAREMVMGGDQ